MPALLIRQKRDAGTLLGAGDDQRRACRTLGGAICRIDRCRVMTIDDRRLPSEGACARRIALALPAQHGRSTLAEAVHVQDRDQIGQVVETSQLKGLIDAAFGHLAIAKQHPEAILCPVEALGRQRHADGCRQSLTERSSGDFDVGKSRRRMAFDHTPALAQRHQLRIGDRARRLEQCIQQRCCVPLGEDQLVIS